MRGAARGVLLVASVVGVGFLASACGDVYKVVFADAGTGADSGTVPVLPPVDTDGGVVVPGPILDDSYTEGTRLKPNFFTVGTTKVFVDWWDTTLAVHCTFQPSAAGEYRCVPRVPKAYAPVNTFTDPSCSRPLLYLVGGGACASPPKLLDLGSDCAPQIVKGSVSAAVSSYGNGFGGPCAKNTTAPTNAYSKVADLTVAEMARGAIEDGAEDLAGPLKAQYVRGDDGAYGFFRLRPKAFATACAIGPGPDGALHCLPTTTLGFRNPYFADAACTTPIFESGSCSGDAAPAVGRTTQRSMDSCELADVPGDFYALGLASSGTSYSLSGTTCTMGGGGGGGPTGAKKIDPAVDFGTAVRLQVPGDAGLDVVYAMLPSGHRTKIGWYDPAHGADCALSTAADGAWRCLPKGTGSVKSVFSNSGCTTPKLAAYVAPPGVAACRFPDDPRFGGSCPSRCTLPPTPAFASLDAAAAACILAPPARRVFRVGALSGATSALTSTGGGDAGAVCTALTRTDEAVREISEIPATEFVGATVSYP